MKRKSFALQQMPLRTEDGRALTRAFAPAAPLLELDWAGLERRMRAHEKAAEKRARRRRRP